MKPRTVYEKAVQDFTETARRRARLDQHFRQASFAKFKMLMFDDELLKRYGLSKPMVERVLIKVYQTVVLGQQRYRDHS
jgi:transcription initiation factor IIE alpha subunit